MHNAWEKTYGLNMWKNDAALDLDGDGYSNLQEYNGDSEPNNPGSVPQGSKSVLMGDVSGNNRIDVADAIIGLQVVSGVDVSKGLREDYPTSGVDVNGDGRLGLQEVHYIMQKVSELK